MKFTLIALLFLGFHFLPNNVYASTLHLSPGSAKIGTGSVTTVQVRINTGGEAVNAVSAYLSYPADKLDVAWVTYGGSFAIAAEGSYGGGGIRISRGNISGVSGNLLVATIGFRGKGEGSATVSFIGGSAAPRASDSSDSLNLGGSSGGTYTIVKGATTSTAPSDPKTSTAKDTQKPAISNVETTSIGTNSATIKWKTNEKSDSVVEYGLDKDKYFLNLSNATQTTDHLITLAHPLLVAGAKIHFRAASKDVSGNLTYSEDKIFQLIGYSVTVKVVNEKNEPFPNTQVLLYSDPIETTTNTKGEATFTNVTAGKHLVVVKTDTFEKTGEITVAESSNPQNFTISTKNAAKRQGAKNYNVTIVLIVIAILAVVAGIAILIKQIKQKSKTPITNSSIN